MKTKKILIRWFVDFDKEEKFLNEQSKAGWDFWHTNGVIYRFHACEPGEFIYQIDFDEKKMKVQVENQNGILGEKFYFPSGTPKGGL